VREAPSKALVGELAAQSGDSAAAAFSVRQVRSVDEWMVRSCSYIFCASVADGFVQRLASQLACAAAAGYGHLAGLRGWTALASFHVSWPAYQFLVGSFFSHLPQALSTLGMLLGTTAAGLAFALSGRSYEVTFALSAVASLMALALVATAFGRDAAAGAAERGACLQ